jgi:hypothetical protein
VGGDTSLLRPDERLGDGQPQAVHRLLVADLHAARANRSHPRLMTQLLNVYLLVLDDFGLDPFSPQAARGFCEVVSERNGGERNPRRSRKRACD